MRVAQKIGGPYRQSRFLRVEELWLICAAGIESSSIIERTRVAQDVQSVPLAYERACQKSDRQEGQRQLQQVEIREVPSLVPRLPTLLITQCFNRVERCRFARRIVTKEDSDHH